MKKITKLIEHLQGIEQRGGAINSFNISNGIRTVDRDDPEYEEGNEGYIQKKLDGTFSIEAHGRYEP